MRTPIQNTMVNLKHTCLSALQKQSCRMSEIYYFPRMCKQGKQIHTRQASAKCWPLVKGTKEPVFIVFPPRYPKTWSGVTIARQGPRRAKLPGTLSPPTTFPWMPRGLCCEAAQSPHPLLSPPRSKITLSPTLLPTQPLFVQWARFSQGGDFGFPQH